MIRKQKLNARIFEYLQSNSLIYQHQSGFQQNHSTVTQLCFLDHQWRTAIDQGSSVQVAFLDLSKAYDRVSITGLLSKLSLLGFNYSALEWFANFLQKREQCVHLSDATSVLQKPESGTPQGTVLEPVLFLTFPSRSHPTANALSLRMIQLYTPWTSQLYQAASISAPTLTQQVLGLTGGACSLMHQKANISLLDGKQDRVHQSA